MGGHTPGGVHADAGTGGNLTPDPRVAALEARVQAEIVRRAYARGDLSYKLDETQRLIRQKRESAWAPKAAAAGPRTAMERVAAADVPISYFELCARGNGKTFELLVLELETALRVKDARVLHAAPLRDDAEKIARDLMELFILGDCPREMKPEWHAGEGEYRFPTTGAVLRFRGTNNDSVERLRGFGYHLVVLDECGSMDQLAYVFGIVKPLAERMGGKLVLATTPPKLADHESKGIFEDHVKRGSAVTFTLLDNPRKTWEQKAAILLNEGEAPEDVPHILDGRMLPRRTTTLREYFCQWVTDSEMALVPEFTAERERQIVVSWA